MDIVRVLPQRPENSEWIQRLVHVQRTPIEIQAKIFSYLGNEEICNTLRIPSKKKLNESILIEFAKSLSAYEYPIAKLLCEVSPNISSQFDRAMLATFTSSLGGSRDDLRATHRLENRLLDSSYFAGALGKFGHNPVVLKYLIVARQFLRKWDYESTKNGIEQAISSIPQDDIRGNMQAHCGVQDELYKDLREHIGEREGPLEIRDTLLRFARRSFATDPPEKRMALIRHPYARTKLFELVLRSQHSPEERLAICEHRGISDTIIDKMIGHNMSLTEGLALLRNPCLSDLQISLVVALYPKELHSAAYLHAHSRKWTFLQLAKHCTSDKDIEHLLAHPLMAEEDIINHFGLYSSEFLSQIFQKSHSDEMRKNILNQIIYGNRFIDFFEKTQYRRSHYNYDKAALLFLRDHRRLFDDELLAAMMKSLKTHISTEGLEKILTHKEFETMIGKTTLCELALQQKNVSVLGKIIHHSHSCNEVWNSILNSARADKELWKNIACHFSMYSNPKAWRMLSSNEQAEVQKRYPRPGTVEAFEKEISDILWRQYDNLGQ